MYFANKILCIAALNNRIKIFTPDAIFSNQKIADTEDLLRVSREFNYQRMRRLNHAPIFARTS